MGGGKEKTNGLVNGEKKLLVLMGYGLGKMPMVWETGQAIVG